MKLACSVKNLKWTGIFIFLITTLCLVKDPLADKQTLSYKATSIDECIQEKECVWYHFALAIQADPAKHIVTDNVIIQKWPKPIRIGLAQNGHYIEETAIDNYLKQLSPFVTQPVSANTKYNFLIMGTKNIEGELKNEFRETFVKYLGKNIPLEIYKTSAIADNKKCYYFPIYRSKNSLAIDTYFAFIQVDNPNIRACLRRVIFSGFGLADLSWTPLLSSYKESANYSKLELLLIFILYQDYIFPDMSFEDIRKSFDQLYEPSLEYLKEAGARNDNR